MMTEKRTISLTWHQWTVLFLALLSFSLAAYLSDDVFERLPHLEDEIAYVYQARIFAGGQVTVETPSPDQAFWQPFVIDSDETGQTFGKYTPGYPAVLAIGVLLGQKWVINALLAAVTVVLTYRLGREIYSPDVGVIAAALVTFSPASLLLNASLMGHTAALCWATLFMYAYWRMERGTQSFGWGAVAGLALGTLAATRPLTAIAIGVPFIVWSGARLIGALLRDWIAHPATMVSPRKTRGHDDASPTEQTEKQLHWRHAGRVLVPLLLIAAFASVVALSIPAFNYAATGDPTHNMYTDVWEYDRIGFGECCGRNTHRLEKAYIHTRFDLSLTAADMFGWQIAPIDDDMRDHWLGSADYWDGLGLSFVLLPFGVIIGLLTYIPDGARRIQSALLLLMWSVGAVIWVLLPLNLEQVGLSPELIADPGFSWLWVLVATGWLLLPLFGKVRFGDAPQVPYTWLFMSVVLGIVLVQMLYWIGSQRYSTRYYFEALTAAALISAIPLGWLAQRVWRPALYGVVGALCAWSFATYGLPRVQVLHGFNMISMEQINAVYDRQADDRPVLVIVNGSTSGGDRVRWRSYGALMAMTSPYLDSEIVVARDYGSWRGLLREKFPDRQIIDLYAQGNDWSFESFSSATDED